MHSIGRPPHQWPVEYAASSRPLHQEYPARVPQRPAHEAERDSSPSCIWPSVGFGGDAPDPPPDANTPPRGLIDPRRRASPSMPWATSTAETVGEFVFCRLTIDSNRSSNTNKRRFGGAPFACYIFHFFVITRNCVNANLKLTHLGDKRQSKSDPPWAPFGIKLMPF